MHSFLSLRRLRCFASLLGSVLLAVPLLSAAANAGLDLTAGEPFLFGAETELREPLYSWVLSKDGQIIETQAEKFFRTNPAQAGTMDLALTIRSADGTDEEKHSFLLRIVPKAEFDPAGSDVVRAVIRTEPPAGGPEKTVPLSPEGGIITLYADESTGNIREYRIDANIAFDTDGDTIPDNDADNSIHPSFTSGGSFPMSIVPASGERERIVQLRVLGMNGELSEARIRVLFDPNVTLTPVLRTLPPMESGDIIRLPAEGGVVRFDATLSGGGASRYSVDLDHSADADRDGNPANDNDFRGIPFELSGTEAGMLLLPVAGAAQRRISLTVMNASGETSTRTFTLIFGDGVALFPQPEPASGPALSADRDLLSVGSAFTLRVENAPFQTVSYAWDLQSDGVTDTETNQPSLLLEPDAPGILPVRVLLKDTNGGTVAAVSREFTVHAQGEEGSPEGTAPLPAGDTSLRIDSVTEELVVSFQPVFQSGNDFAGLYPSWDFGDGSKSYLLAPVHAYEASGTYEVKLTLTDPASGREVASAVTTVSVEGAPATAPVADAGFFAGFLRTFGFILKVILFVLFLLLLFTGGVLAYAFLQAKTENVPFRDILLSYKRKISGETESESMAKSVPEIIEAASVKKKESDEPAPMKLVAEEVPKKTPPPPPPPAPRNIVPPEKKTPPVAPPPSPPQAPVAPVKAPESSAPVTEKGQLPPWLQTEEKPSTPPRSTPVAPKPSTPPPPSVRTPPPPAKPAMPPVPSPVTPPVQPKQPVPPPAKTEEMPAWLKQGMEKTATPPPAPKPVTPPVSLPKPVTAPVALPVPPVQQALPPPSAAIPDDDEPIAMLRAELPEEEEKKEDDASQ